MIRKSTWILLAVFALALAGAWYWQRQQAQQEAETTPTPEAAGYLFDFGESSLSGMRLERVGDQSVELKRAEDGTWTPVSPAQPYPLDSQLLDGTLGQLAAMATLTTLDAPPGLADMGLDLPMDQLQITLADGRELKAAIGKATPTGSGYYVRVEDQAVYVVSKYSIESITELVDKLPLLEPTETPVPATLDETPAAGEPSAGPTPVGTP